MVQSPTSRVALVLLVVAVAGCGSRVDEAQFAGQLAAAEAAAAKAVAAQHSAERAAASIAAPQTEEKEEAVLEDGEVVVEDDDYDPDSEVFDNTIVSPPAPEAPPPAV